VSDVEQPCTCDACYRCVQQLRAQLVAEVARRDAETVKHVVEMQRVTGELAEARRTLREDRPVIRVGGVVARRCDIAACNCGEYHSEELQAVFLERNEARRERDALAGSVLHQQWCSSCAEGDYCQETREAQETARAALATAPGERL
jgi:hypothetical protein